MNKIVLEDFNEGDGYFKVNLAYLTKEQVEEIESIVSKWNPTDEDIKSCIEMCLTDANEQRFKDYGTNLKECLDWIEKQWEQKSTDKVEPMFHEGDWIVNNDSGGVCQVTEIRDGEYGLWPLDGDIVGYLRIIDVDDEYHLWTIKDAKDGDVLVYNNSSVEIILLFKKWMDGVGNGAYSYAHTFNNEILFNDWSDCGYGTRPATKEQHAHLFEKMHEACYEWDEKKKKLRKIEKQGDNPADVGLAELGKIWEEKQLQVDGFDAELNALLKKYEHLSKKELQEPLKFYLDVIKNDLDVVREEKWSEEDENFVTNICSIINADRNFTESAKRRFKDWLKSLKQKMEEK